MSPTPIVHALTFYYSRSFSLYDVVRYKQRQIKRIGTGTSPINEIHKLNKFIMKNISRSNQTGERRIKEDLINEVDCVSKDYQIQSLKDRLKIARDTIQSLRNKIEQLRKRKNNGN
jgi:predicted RNase H-like nuclease (RuvC/YqgF family)